MLLHVIVNKLIKHDKNDPKSKPTSKPGPNKDSAHGSGHVKVRCVFCIVKGGA